MNNAVSDANGTGYNLGKTNKETTILATPSAYGLVSKDDLNASVADAISNGLTQGKQYVQDNLSEFDLVSKPTIEVSPTTLSSLDTGWTLASTPFEITDLSVFDSVNLVWIFNSATASWSAYSSDADTMAAINSADYVYKAQNASV